MSIHEMIAVVQVYIHIRKGVEVKIKVTSPRDIMLLQLAYEAATEWMQANNTKIVATR